MKLTNEALAEAQADLGGLLNWTDANHEQCIIWKQISWEVLMYVDGYYHNCVWYLHRGLKDVVYELLHIASPAVTDLIYSFSLQNSFFNILRKTKTEKSISSLPDFFRAVYC